MARIGQVFAMAVDVEVGKAGCRPERGTSSAVLRQLNQDVGLRRAASTYVADLLGDSFVERCYPAAGFLQLRP